MNMSYNMVISLGGRVSLLSRTDIMFSTCMAMTRHNSRPCGQRGGNMLQCIPLKGHVASLECSCTYVCVIPAPAAAERPSACSCPQERCPHMGNWFQQWASGCGWTAPPPGGPLPSAPAPQSITSHTAQPHLCAQVSVTVK